MEQMLPKMATEHKDMNGANFVKNGNSKPCLRKGCPKTLICEKFSVCEAGWNNVEQKGGLHSTRKKIPLHSPTHLFILNK